MNLKKKQSKQFLNSALVCPEQSDIHIESLKVYDSEIDILPIIERIGGYREKIFDEIKKWL